ncbi:MAG: efflux RND transporter permease subunit, partial [Sphaerochaetaceae bacterium]|nr:efflux RND transporter permease subunit [Sphaerochaetaceae bacterium]
LVAFGIYCVFGINVEFMSDMSLPSIEVLTIYPGAVAEDVETDVTKVLEDEFVTLPNFKSISSTNRNSLSWITVKYDDSVDPYDQLAEIRYRIDQLEDVLPADIQGKPIAMVGGASMLPIFEFSVSGGSDIGRITTYLNDEVVPMLTKIDGVSDISISGGNELEVQIKLRLDDLQSKGISVLSVYQLLNYSNINVPLDDASYNEKNVSFNYDGRLKSLDDIASLTVGMGDDNVMVRLGDIADISYVYPESDSRTFSDGDQVIIVQVSKRTSGNTMSIIKQVKQVLKQIESETNGALKCTIISDDSRSVITSLTTVIESGILGVIMAVVVIFLFLSDARATVIIGLSIPLSILFTFLGMKVLGMTINLISVSGLVVALGMIVDASIVMLEQVFRNFRIGKLSPADAIIKSSDEVGGSIVASNLTTIVVFIPMIFLNGIVGMIIKDFAITLVLCLFASLLVAIVVVPFLLRLFFGNKLPKEHSNSIFLRGYAKLEGGYQRSLKWCLGERKFIVLIPILLLVLSLLLATMLGYTFIPSVDNGDFYASFEFPTGYTADMTEAKMKEAERIIRAQVPEIEAVAVYSGQSSELGGMGSDTVRFGYAHVVLNSSDERDRKIKEIIISLQKVLSEQMTDCIVEVKNGGFDHLLGYVTDGGGYQISLVGNDVNQLYQSALDVQNALKDCSSVVTTTVDTNFNSVNVTLDMSQQYLNSLGITSYEAGIVSRILFSGIDSGKMSSSDGERYSIKLTSDASEQPLTEDLLSKLVIQSAAGDSVSFSGLGSFKVDNTINAIKHKGRLKAVSVSATLLSDDTSEVNQKMNAYFESNPLPEGVSTESGGTMKLITDSMGEMITALAIAIFLVYAVMVIQFERFKQPLIIMLSVPFAIIGVVIGLLIFGSNLNLMSVVAIISLAGVVVNNAIILVDYMNLLRDRKRASRLKGVDEEIVDTPLSDVTHEDGAGEFLGEETELQMLSDSVCAGGSSRLRPILMTTLTTMFGIFPMALSVGAGAELYAPVGQAIFGGLFASTLITLFLVPVVYYSFERKMIRKKSRRLGGDDDEKA